MIPDVRNISECRANLVMIPGTVSSYRNASLFKIQSTVQRGFEWWCRPKGFPCTCRIKVVRVRAE